MSSAQRTAPADAARQDAMFGEEEAGQAHSNKEAAVLIAYEAVQTGLLTDMVSYLGESSMSRCSTTCIAGSEDGAVWGC